MTKLFYTYIRQAAEDVSLTEAESARMRSTLQSYMEMKPIRTAQPARSHSPRITWHAFASHPALAFVAICAILGSSAGVSYAAESALPGDALYPVKVALNEPVRGVLAVTPKAKADWAIQVAGERAKEAATLAAEHRLDEQTQGSLEASLIEHAQIATASIQEQAGENPSQGAALATRFEARLSEYERVITAIDTDSGEHASIATTIRDAKDRIAVVRSSAERASDDHDNETAHLSSAAKADLASSNFAALRAADALTPDTAAGIAERIDAASNTIAVAQEMASTDAPLARGKLRKALQDSERIRTYVDTSAAIHERTGLTISQPVAIASRTAKNGRSGKKGSEPVTVTAAMAPQASTFAMPLATAVPATTSATTTASTTEDVSDRHGHEDSHDEEGDHHRDEKLLTIPAPEL